ncbi:MAG: hypothetical protein ACLQMS_13165 [Desulfomonilaceae bacterium]
MVSWTKRSEKTISVVGWRHEFRLMWLKRLAICIGLIGIAGIFVIGEGLGNQLSQRHERLLLAQQSSYCHCKMGKTIVWMPAKTCHKIGGKCR